MLQLIDQLFVNVQIVTDLIQYFTNIIRRENLERVFRKRLRDRLCAYANDDNIDQSVTCYHVCILLVFNGREKKQHTIFYLVGVSYLFGLKRITSNSSVVGECNDTFYSSQCESNEKPRRCKNQNPGKNTSEFTVLKGNNETLFAERYGGNNNSCFMSL